MLYAAYEAQRVTLDGARAASRAALGSLDLLPPPIADLDPVRRLRAAHQVFVDSVITHERLPFGIDRVGVETPAGVRAVAVHEQVVTRTPFCTLLRFARTGLLTVEGERDDLCGPGQTMAAHELCSRIPAYRRRHHLQAGVGHFGVFSGRRWEGQVYPVLRSFIAANS